LLRVLLVCLGVLAVIYFLKAFLLQLATGSRLGADELSSTSGEAQGGNLTVLQAAFEAYRRSDDAEAIEMLSSCMQKSEDQALTSTADGAWYGEAAACRTALAEMYLVGAGVQRNLTEALQLLQQSADEGEPDAQFNLGMLYASSQPGDELHRSEAMAVLHLYAASSGGHPGALMAMGYRHLHGYGVPQACSTAALNYIDVAKQIAGVYSSGMPQAVELIRLNLHQKDRKVITSSELNLFVQIATSGDSTVAAAIGKRYLLGIEGFRQDYQKAKHYLRMAGNRQHAGALALLGYMHCLGLGMPQNLDTAYAYFVTAATHNDPLGHNGLGFIYFKGTNALARNWRLAFKHFNESAFGGSSDGMFNLASMYLTGVGTDQSFQKAVLYYTQALDRGHTPAAYSLAVMHLNGIGTVRDCDIAVNLLKKVCERGNWVSSKLVAAYEFGDDHPDKAALLFLKLAEAGHEVGQMNAAHLFDAGQSSLLTRDVPGNNAGDIEDDLRSQGRNFAQRFYELSAEQGSASSELRLGDYAYYGWGTSASFSESFGPSSRSEEPPQLKSAEEEDWDDFHLPDIYTNDQVDLHAQPVDYEASLARYRKTAEMTVTGEWMQSFVARASFNLGFMHQFGIGIHQDMHMAKQHYFRCREVDPSGLHMPVTMALAALATHAMFLRVPNRDQLMDRLLVDNRVHLVFMHLLAVIFMVALRCYLSRRRYQPQSVTPRRSAAPAQAAAAEAPGLSEAGERIGGASSTAGESRRATGNLVLD